MKPLLLLAALLIAMPASAALPAPSQEEVAAAEAKKAKTADAAKQATELLAKAQDRAVEDYKRTQANKGQAGNNGNRNGKGAAPAP